MILHLQNVITSKSCPNIILMIDEIDNLFKKMSGSDTSKMF